MPWAHGFKSIKWLQTDRPDQRLQANDTYALQNNDPESYLKTAAYLGAGERVVQGRRADLSRGNGDGRAGRGSSGSNSGCGPATGGDGKLADDDPAWKTALWRPAS